MSLRKYLFLLVALFTGIVARGQDFNPTNPAEPSATYLLTLKAAPAEGGTVTGGGKYAAGKKVTVKATPASVAWRFVNWTDSSGEELSTSASYSYTTTPKNETLTAHFEAVQTSTITLSYTPVNAGLSPSLTGANTYAEGTVVTIKANSYSNWTFVNWTRKSNGEVMSTDLSFKYTTTADDVEFVANYRFTPGSNPAEPSQTKASHKVYFSTNPADAGTFNRTNGYTVKEDASYNVTTTAKTGWKFVNWTMNGEEVGTSATYYGTMKTEDQYLVANFVFNPAGPNDPSQPTKNHFTLYGQTQEMYKGQQTMYPVYLENTISAKDLSFTLLLPEGVTVDTDNIVTTSRTSAYSASGAVEGNVLTVSITGGTQISDNNGPVVMLPINTTQAIEDGTYPLEFGSASLTLLDESTPAVTFRRGQIVVTTLEEGDIQASFSVDRYMNRAQFTNLSTDGCKTFTWYFGDGETSTEVNPMHIYATPGTYTVRLEARGIIKTSDAEQNIIINAPSTWTASGDYTLNKLGTGVRNFTSMHEAMSLLSECSINGNITISVSNDSEYAMQVTHADSLALLTTMASKLSASQSAITFVGLDEHPSVLAFNANLIADDLQAAMTFIKDVKLQDAVITLNEAPINAGVINEMVDEVICAEASTTPIALTTLSSSPKVKVEWSGLVAAGSKLSEYQVAGTGDIPSMQIKNAGNAVQTVTYNINYTLDDVVLYSCSHKISVRPLLSQQTITYSGIADGAVDVSFGNHTLSWTNLGTMASEGYTLTITRTDNGSDPVVVETKATSYTLTCIPGASYTWQVTAHGSCDDLDGPVYTFSVRDQADLAVVSVTVPNSSRALTSVVVEAVVQNVGKASTVRNSWTDAIYRSRNANDFSNAVYLTSVSHNGALAPGDSYTVSFTTISPDSEQGECYYYVKTDYNNNESESNESNNVRMSEPMAIADSFMDEGDYAALKALFNATNGEAWTNKWKVNSNAINSTAWPGVTFNDDGRVVAINVANNNLVGTLPTEEFALPMLTSLNLSRNTLNGDLAEFVSGCTALTTLNMSYCRLTELTGALNSKITSLDLSYQNDSRALSFFDKQEWDMGGSVENVVLGSLLSYNHKAGDFSAHPHMYIYNVGGSYLGSMSYTDGAYRLSLSGDYKQPNNAEVYLMPTEGVARYTRLHASLSWLLGDSNVDAVVDVLDAQHTLNRILARQSGSFNFSAGNVYNTDDVINVQDVVATINLFIEDDVPVGAKGDETVAPGNASEKGTELYTTADGLYLDAEQGVAALDITLQGVKASQVSLQLSHSKFQMFTSENEGGLRIVILSPSGYDIPAGKTRILKLSQSNTAIVAAKAADIDAQEVMVNVVSAPTGIEDMEMLQDMPQNDDVYDIQGRKVESPRARGIYIQNGRKVIIK